MFKLRQFKRKKFLIIIFAAILLIFMIGFINYKTFSEDEQVLSFGHKITKFDVESQNLNCTNSEEIKGLLHRKSLNYFYFKAQSLEEELRKKFLCIGKIESELSYPDKLKLKIAGRVGKFIVTSINPNIETNPQIILSLDQMNATQSTTEAFPPKVLNQILDSYKDASASAMYLADEEGMVFEEVFSDTAFLKLAIFSIDIKIGQKIPNDFIKKTSEIVEKLKITDLALDNLIIVGDRLIIDSKPRITFSLDKDINRQSASLQLILRQAKMNLDPERRDTRSVESIDLRFDRPVVMYSK